MHCLQDAQVVVELPNEGVTLVAVIVRLFGDGPVKALKPFSAETCRAPVFYF